MPRVRDVLYRFRPTGAPGPAGPAAVPADRSTDRAVELEPVFDLLADIESRCAAVREGAVHDAEVRRERAAEGARRLLADARSRAAGERAAAAARVAARAAGESAATVEAARSDADRLLVRATGRTPGCVARLVAEVETVLDHAPEVHRR